MALITCPECGHPVSDKAVRCPQCKKQLIINQISEEEIACHECGVSFSKYYAECPNCGCPVRAIGEQINIIDKQLLSNTTPKNYNGKKVFMIAILLSVAIVICALVFILRFTKSTETERELGLASPEINTSQSSSPAQKYFDDSILEFKFLDLSMFSEVWHKGVYKCGIDIDPGEYYLLTIYDGTSIRDVSNSSDNFAFVGNGVIYKISIKENQYIDVPHGMILASANEVERRKWNELGVFLVGEDLPAGEYKIGTLASEYEENGYFVKNISAGYSIFDNHPGTKPISGDFLREQKYITVERGQYLALRNAKLTLIEEITETSTSENVTKNEESSSEDDKYANFEKSSVYLAVLFSVEENLKELNPRVDYKVHSRTLEFYFESPEGTAFNLLTNNPDVIDSWNTLVENSRALCEAISIMIHDAGYNIDCIFYILSDYNQDQALLFIRDGEIVYNASNE